MEEIILKNPTKRRQIGALQASKLHNQRLLKNADLESSDDANGGQIKGQYFEIECKSEDSEELHRRLKANLSQSDL